jgi:dephospho-CoA kinase
MKKPNTRREKIVLGLTGGFGTGKTTVAGLLRAAGAKVIDADKIARRLLDSCPAVSKKIIREFGSQIVKKGHTIDRAKLAEIVFNDTAARGTLNAIVHPEVVREIKKEITQSPKRCIVVDLPLLFEAKLEYLVDKIIVVKASNAQQLERLLERTTLSKTEIIKRIHAQMPLSYKVRKADFVIDNSGTIEKTKEQVGQLRRMLWKN